MLVVFNKYEFDFQQFARVGDVSSIQSLLESKGSPGDVKVTRFVNEMMAGYTALHVRHNRIVFNCLL
jgi:hypothetical protein